MSLNEGPGPPARKRGRPKGSRNRPPADVVAAALAPAVKPPSSGRPKDPYRGIDRDRLDRFVGFVGPKVAEMYMLYTSIRPDPKGQRNAVVASRSELPLRGEALDKLLAMVRNVRALAEMFEGDIELAR